MRKIPKYYTAIKFLLLFAIWSTTLTGQTLQPGSAIRLQPIPETATPTISPEASKARKIQRQEYLNKKRLFLKPPEETPADLNQRQLEQEAERPRPMRFYLQASLAYSDIVTSGSRKNYVLEPTTLIHGIFRFSEHADTSQPGFYYGLRIAQFNGVGVNNNSPGRFGFSYFGPMVGLGSFGKAAMTEPARKGAQADLATPEIRKGYWILTGVSMVSRFAETPSDDPMGEDFENQGLFYEAPGMWAETIYHWTFYNSFSLSTTLGVHAAKEKLFYYAGLGVGGWH